ncbi:hypothetical protein CXG81DRAFT_26531 [Caulochytrium protostelioides]|uniref:Uncharacterized protein n=1 Tax=Caulochytrium protostelioides TaxID=1555241 RepID=A0A4P9X6G7_9FUNG|nr:hypothetical protein CXG81DRAFT_26531 [Caulochytrium protostelioides]|eukprot:RKP00787.1 hypothetical protein CXG81DRAFT_26531 [Caulochytrium protostelioides]
MALPLAPLARLAHGAQFLHCVRLTPALPLPLPALNTDPPTSAATTTTAVAAADAVAPGPTTTPRAARPRPVPAPEAARRAAIRAATVTPALELAVAIVRADQQAACRADPLARDAALDPSDGLGAEDAAAAAAAAVAAAPPARQVLVLVHAPDLADAGDPATATADAADAVAAPSTAAVVRRWIARETVTIAQAAAIRLMPVADGDAVLRLAVEVLADAMAPSASVRAAPWCRGCLVSESAMRCLTAAQQSNLDALLAQIRWLYTHT